MYSFLQKCVQFCNWWFFCTFPVESTDNGVKKKLAGLQHFFHDEIENCKLLWMLKYIKHWLLITCPGFTSVRWADLCMFVHVSSLYNYVFII